jgi:hypothetical protein
MKPTSSNFSALDTFKRWYSSTGHWVYNGRADAVQTWTTRGINTLPAAPAGAREALAGWIAQDFVVPALRPASSRAPA